MVTTPYEILGVKENATPSEIKSAYKALVKIYHPDVNSTPNAAAFFRLVQSSYETLTSENANNEEQKTKEQAYKYNTYNTSNRRQYTKEEIEELIRNNHIIKNKVARNLVKIPVYIINFAFSFIIFALVFISAFAKIAGSLAGGLAALMLITKIFEGWRTVDILDVVTITLMFSIAGILCFGVDIVIIMLQTIKHFLQEMVQ